MTSRSIQAADHGTLRLLRESALFRSCSADELVELARISGPQSFPPGADIVREGDEARHVYLIEEGDVAALKARSTGSAQHEMGRMGAGDHFGEMALLDSGGRSATVRALSPVRVLAIPIAGITELAAARPHFAGVVGRIAGQVVARFRDANAARVEALDRALEEERTRVAMGTFVLALIVANSLYVFLLGTAARLTAAAGRSEVATIPIILMMAAVQLIYMRRVGFPPRFFGLTLENAGRHALEALVFTAPLAVLVVAVKLALLAYVPSMHGLPVFQMFAQGASAKTSSRFNPALALAYVLFIPAQELIHRGGTQGGLQYFLSGKGRTWKAIVASNILFSAGHLHISSSLSIAVFVIGLFWGWLYARQRTLVGVSLSHILLGFWALEVVDLGVLE